MCVLPGSLFGFWWALLGGPAVNMRDGATGRRGLFFSLVCSLGIMTPTPSKHLLLLSGLQSRRGVFEICLWSHL